MSVATRRVAGLLAALWLCACGPPTQYRGPIPFDQEGLARRMRVLCQLGVGSGDVRAACQTPAFPRGAKPAPAVGGDVAPPDRR